MLLWTQFQRCERDREMTSRTRKRLLILVCLAVVAGVGMVSVHFLREARMAELIADARAEGYQAYEEQRFEDALEPLTFYVSNQHDDIDALLALAECRRRCPVLNRAHLHNAKDLALLVRTAHPTNMRALEMLLGLYRDLGYQTERLDIADQILALEENHEDALEAKVMALASLRRLSDALEAADQYARAKPDDAQVHRLKLQLMHIADADGDQIRDHAVLVASQHPDDPDFAILRAQGHMAASEDQMAMEVLRATAAMPIEEWEVMGRLIGALDTFGMYGEATATLQAGLANVAFHERALALAVSRQWHRGALAEARTVLSSSETTPSDADVHVVGWGALLALSDNDAVATESGPGPWNVALAQRESEAATVWQLIVQSQEQRDAGDLSACRSSLEHARDEGRRLADADDDAMPVAMTLIHCLLGEAALDLLEPERAIRDLDAAVNLDPSSARIHVLHARADLELGHLDDAVEHAERAFLIKPATGQAIGLLRVYVSVIESGEGDGPLRSLTLQVADQLLADQPDHADLRLMALWARAACGQEADVVKQIATWSADDWARVSDDIVVDFASAAGRYGLEIAGAPGSALARQQKIVRVVSEAIAMARRGEIEHASALLAEASANETDAIMQRELELTRLRLLDQAGASETLSVALTIAETWPDDLATQRSVLQTRQIWTNEPLVQQCVDRVEALAGKTSLTWRLFEAQRLMIEREAIDEAAQDLALATEHVLGVLREVPDHLDALVLRADIERIEGNMNRAIESLETAVDRHASARPTLLPLLITMLHQSGHANEASRRLDEFFALDLAGPTARRRRAEMLDAHGRSREAALDYIALREQAEEIMVARDFANAAKLFVKIGDRDEATEWYEAALDAPVCTHDVVGSVAVHLASMGREDDAAALIRSLPADRPESTLTQAAYEEALGHFTAAESILVTYAGAAGTPDAWETLAKFYRRQDRLADASDAVAAGLALDPQHAELMSVQATIRLLTDDFSSSEARMAAFATMIESAESKALARLAASIVAFEQSDKLEQAQATFEETLRSIVADAPTEFLPWQYLVSELFQTAQFQEAIDMAYRASRSMPGSIRAARLTAETVILCGRWDEGLAAVRTWRDLSSGDTFKPDMVTATISLQQGDIETAYNTTQAWAKRIVREMSRQPSWGVALVVASEFASNTAEDDDNVATALELLETSDASVTMLAEWRYRAALRLGSTDPDVWTRIVNGLQPIAEAGALASIPMLCLADAMVRLDDVDGAEQIYRQALARDGQNSRVLISLASFLLQHREGSGEALVCAEQAVKAPTFRDLSPQARSAVYDTLGRAYLASAALDQAEEAFETGRSLDVTSVDLRIGLVEVWIARDEIEEASRELVLIDSMDDQYWLPERIARVAALRERVAAVQRSF